MDSLAHFNNQEDITWKIKNFVLNVAKKSNLMLNFVLFVGLSKQLKNPLRLIQTGPLLLKKRVLKKRWYKRWWIWIIAVVVILLILSSIGNFFSPDPKDVASDIKTTLQQDNAVDVVSVKADKSTGTIKVKVKETKAIEQLYEGYPAGFKALQRDLVNSSKKYANKKNDDFDLSYIQLMKPGTSHKILLAVDKGKIKYTALDN